MVKINALQKKKNTWFEQFILPDSTAMANLGELFDLADRFEGTEKALKPVKHKKIGGRKLKRNFKKFKTQVTRESRLSHDEKSRWNRALK